MTLSHELNDSDFESYDASLVSHDDPGESGGVDANEPERPHFSRWSSAPPFALPAQPGPLIGRDALLARVTAYLDNAHTRLITLIGPGGVGKTRLACEVARQREREHEIVRFIDLAQLQDGASIAETIHEALGSARLATEPLADQHVIMLGNRRALLVLDNFEHVVDAAPQVAELLADAPWLQIIVTSRVFLRLRWELICPVPPLALPADGNLPALDELEAVPSVALFLSFIRRHHPEFALTTDNARIVGEICRRMDGLPLALELAAADLRVMPIERLLERVDRPLDALVRGPRDLPRRQQTMRATIEWSYALLAAEDQRVVRRLAIFAGGAAVSAVEDVLNLPHGSAYDILVNLAEQNLFEFVEESHAEPRFRMQRMVREYLAERFADDDDRATIRRRFNACYVRLAEDACARLNGAQAHSALATLQAELGNLHQILDPSLDAETVTDGIHLALVLMPFWARPGQLAEGRRWFERLIAVMPSDDPALGVEARVAASRLAVMAGDVIGASQLLDDARLASNPLDRSAARAPILAWSCYVRLLRGDIGGAAHILETAPELRDAEPPYPGDITPDYLRAMIAVERGADDANALLDEALNTFDAIADHARVIDILCAQAERAFLASDVSGAAKCFAEALVRARIASEPRSRIRPLIGLGDIAGLQPSGDEALHHYREAFDIAREYEDEHATVRLLERLAVLGVSSRIVPSLLRLIGLADTMRARLGIGRSAFDQHMVVPKLQHARTMLGADEFARIHADGEALSLSDVVAEFDAGTRWNVPVAEARGAMPPLTIDHLTRREREVVQQISKGYTNRQIAANLGMAERTVDSHIGNIRQKLQLPSRARIAVWAVANGLSTPD